MRRTTVVVAIAAALLLTGCSGEAETPDDKPSAKPTSAIPSPDAEQTRTLIADLRGIDPGLVAKEDRAVRRARNVCSDIRRGGDESAVHEKAKLRFEGGTVPEISGAQAGKIVSAVKESFCA